MSDRNEWGKREEGDRDFWTEGDGGVWRVSPEDELPDAHPHSVDFFAQLKASLEDDLMPGGAVVELLAAGEYDELLTFAHLSGRAGEKATTAEMEYVTRWASQTLSDAMLLLAAIKGTFHMPAPRNGRALVGIRERFRDQLKRRLKDIEGKFGDDAPAG